MRYRTLAAAIAGLMLTGCLLSSPEQEKQRHREQGLSLYDAGELERAASEFRAVVDLDPNDADAYYRLGLIAERRGGQRDRFAGMVEWVRATELDHDHREATLRLADLYIRADQLAQAKLYVVRLLAAQPRDADALLLRGRIAAREQDYATAIGVFQQAIAAEPSLIEGYRQLALAHEGSGDPQAAERTLRRAMEKFGPGTDIALSLGDLLQRTEQYRAATDVYRVTLRQDPENERLLLRLAQAYRAVQAWGDAEAIYAGMRARKPEDERPLIWLGDLLRAAGRPQEAVARYQEALTVRPSSLLARDRVIDQLLITRDIDGAEARVQTIYDSKQDDPMAWYFDGRIRAERGDADRAVELLRAVTRTQPRFAAAYHHLGRALLETGERGQALQALTKAVDLDPDDTDARVTLGMLYLSQGALELAQEQARVVRRSHAADPRVAELLGDIAIRQRRYAEAQQIFESLAIRKPDDPAIDARLGRIARARQDEARAERHLEEALRLNPDGYEPLWQLVEMRIAADRREVAGDRVQAQLARSPGNPLFRYLLGVVWRSRGETVKAEEAFTSAADRIRSVASSPRALRDLYRKTGLLTPRLAAEQRTIFAAHMALGELYETGQDYPRAVERYREVLKLEPHLSAAAHRLAWILSERQGDLDGALTYAQMAVADDPQNPRVADTLGWIYYRKNLRLRALTLLREAATALPSDATIQEHYRIAREGPEPAGQTRPAKSNVLLSGPARSKAPDNPFGLAP